MPHSILMMHHPSGASRGQASEMHIESRELVRVRDYLSLVISDSTGQPYDRVSCWVIMVVEVVKRLWFGVLASVDSEELVWLRNACHSSSATAQGSHTTG
jgi:hypothetical protein